jgi:hypothetical protein
VVEGAGSPRSVVLVALLMAALSTAPYLRATFSPPPGAAFTGFFWFTDDAYNYLSFVQQAEDGAFVFRNKLVLVPHSPALLNPEWWLVGVLSRLLGREPVLAYRLFALAAIFALVAAIHAALRDAGLPATHATAALLLTCLGGGAGVACLWLGHPSQSCLDMSAGLFPFLEILANPHFVAGTALLLWSLRAFRIAQERGGVGPALAAAALATVLGLVRPYDLVLLVAIRSVVVAVTEPGPLWIRHAGAMALLLPVVAYLAWVFYGIPAFTSFMAIHYAFPPVREFAWALAPAAVVAVAAWATARARGLPTALMAGDRSRRAAVLHFAVWLALAAVVIAAQPVTFSLQFLVGVGLPLLALAALALAPFPPAVTLLAALALASSAAVAFWITLRPSPSWYVPAERLAVARALREPCRPGEVVLSPPDIGLYAGGLSSCTPYLSHAAAAGYEARAAEVRRFYESPDPVAGAALLARSCATHVVLPAAASLAAHAGADAPYRASALAGRPPQAIAVYSRAGGPACAGAAP